MKKMRLYQAIPHAKTTKRYNKDLNEPEIILYSRGINSTLYNSTGYVEKKRD
jgi:hypothetical protein